MSTAAEELVGVQLVNGWRPYERLPKKPNESGGYFSVGYLAKNEDGRVGFLKALDYARLLASSDPASVLAVQTSAFNFERDLLRICRSRNLTRVIRVLDEGSIHLPHRGVNEVVQYLIFERADGDARRQADLLKRYDPAWALRTLHQVSVGLSQLHSELIAHQDLKPSNILIFGNRDTKIADLGRAAWQASPAPHESNLVAGDGTYAPPECLYSAVANDWFARRLGCDQYLLGSLVVSFFLGTAMTPLVQATLHENHRARNWSGMYKDVLPYVRNASDQVLEQVEGSIRSSVGQTSGVEISRIVRELCEPDCALRGHPRDRVGTMSQRSLQRYISAFDRLSRQIPLRKAA